ncbi:AbrB/MazE/SpoVT family DNA-binding domain-containing protein [Paraclostridium sordellii]|uniref:AbrB/MazE/SpoVT family DNA-binding domain-containing protein n=1 Tax=Paraclostridium sordellii TaxID=1505 RepID=UPI0005E1FFEF|nr:AbrB/MazE/SpoVT family DNA-binding domain-containing protein [Paeniclostridium sordellii]CEN77434.1 AbrB family transcriptional regulator [[Clostridium] sordellii] [Paeniclostridium sordellii]
MKNQGIVRSIDSLGRVVIPKEFRKILNLNTNDSVEILCVDGFIKIKKYNNICAFCGSKENLKDIKNIYICEKCIKELKNTLE